MKKKQNTATARISFVWDPGNKRWIVMGDLNGVLIVLLDANTTIALDESIIRQLALTASRTLEGLLPY